MTGGKPWKRKGGTSRYLIILLLVVLFVCLFVQNFIWLFSPGNLSESTRSLSTRTSQPIHMTSHSWNLVNFPKFSWCGSKSIAEERVDLSKFPPVCLPQTGEVFPLNTTAFVYGGCTLQVMIIWSYWLYNFEPNEWNILSKAGERLTIRTQQTSFKRQRWCIFNWNFCWEKIKESM